MKINSPLQSIIKGKSGNTYPFLAYNIDDKFDSKSEGVYIFCKIVLDDKYEPTSSFIQIAEIKFGENNLELFETAKQNGATYFFYHHCSEKDCMKNIIAEISGSLDEKKPEDYTRPLQKDTMISSGIMKGYPEL